jgi:PAS domain S-box-containing protein
MTRAEGALPPARGHVMIVDDHEALADNLREILLAPPEDDDEGEPAVEVTVLGTGKRALKVAKERGFDVAIVDVKLPDGSGVDLLPALKEAAPGGEVILITGFATIDAAIAALRGGAFALLLKSFRPEELRSTVEQALVKVALRRERDVLERRYRALVEVADVLVIGLDREGHAALVNPKFTALTGVSAQEATGSDLCQRWIVEDDRPRFREALASVASTGAPRELEARLLVLGGDHARMQKEPPNRVIRWNLSAEGAGGLVFGIGVDVTDRRALERRAANAEALSTMGTLALGLAHEIRNPLNAAVLQMHLLGRQVEREVKGDARGSMRDRVQIVVGEIKRLGRLLTEFLELARPRGLAREPVAVGELIDGVLELHREEAKQRGISFARGGDDDTLPPVLGDREKLRQVFVNLVVNAIDATPSGGEIRITARAAIDRVIVEVADTGSGIAEADLVRLFDPFFTTKPGGTGLGLSIVRKILEQHEGVIHVRSVMASPSAESSDLAPVAASGTTVQVELPTAKTG